jgi:DNA-binding response OmpR family regulator
MYSTHQATIDLILLDINMPVLGGKDTFELLRSINPFCRIIIVTGYGRGVIETSMFSGDVNGFMQKPFQIETLAAKVREVLDQKTSNPDTALG